MLEATLDPSLLGDILEDKGTVKRGDRVIRAGKRVMDRIFNAASSFN